MARRNPLRTPEGAWYRDYAEYKLQNRGSYPPPLHLYCSEAQQHKYDGGFVLSPLPETFDYQGEGYRYGGTERDRQHHPWATMAEYREINGGMGSRPPLYDPDEEQRWKRAQQDQDAKGDRTPRKKWEQDDHHEAKGCFTLDDSFKRNGLGDKEWEPPEQFSPRKTTYEPSFHHVPAAQKNAYLWERERDRGSPHMNGPGQMIASGYDPRMAMYEEPKKAISKQQSGGAFLFIRFPHNRGENYHVTARACLHALTNDLRGRFFGISKKVYDFGYGTEREEGCVVFQFPSLDKAEVFYYRDKRIRQHDFPRPQGHAEIFAIALQRDPNTMQSYDTFLLSEVILNNGMSQESVQEYENSFVKPFTELLSEPSFNALPYAAYCKTNQDRLSLRRRYFPPKTIITLHLFQSPKDLEYVMTDSRYSQLRSVHNSMATERCSLFTVERQLCP